MRNEPDKAASLCLLEIAPNKCCAKYAMISFSHTTSPQRFKKFSIKKTDKFVAVYDDEPTASFACFDTSDKAVSWICANGFTCVATSESWTFSDARRTGRGATVVYNWVAGEPRDTRRPVVSKFPELDDYDFWSWFSYSDKHVANEFQRRLRCLDTIKLRPVFMKLMLSDLNAYDKYKYMNMLFRAARRCKKDRNVYDALKLALDTVHDDLENWSVDTDVESSDPE